MHSDPRLTETVRTCIFKSWTSRADQSRRYMLPVFERRLRLPVACHELSNLLSWFPDALNR